EAMAIGPCGPERCLYIGDVGDNLGVRATRTVYRVRESAAAAQIGAMDGEGRTTESPGRIAAERLDFRFEDRLHDVEAMVVSEDGAIHLITKGRRRGILVYRIAPQAWTHAGAALATLTDSLHIPPVTSRDRVTDAALSPDGTLAVRSYRTLYMFGMDAATGDIASPAPLFACDLTGAREPQGEGIAWMGGDRWLLTSEDRGAPITQVICQGPSVSQRR